MQIFKNVKRMVCLAVLVLGLSSCEKNRVKCTGDSEKTFTATGFNKVSAGDKFNVTITKGTAFSVKAKGCTENINDLNVAVSADGTLNIRYSPTNLVHDKALDLFITMPALLELNVSAAAKANVTGMDNQATYMRIVLSGAAECTVSNAAIEMTFALSGASKLNITGTTQKLIGHVDGASYLHAYGLASQHTDISVSGASKAYVTAQERLSIEASGASEVRYKGNPTHVFTEVSGNAKIIKE